MEGLIDRLCPLRKEKAETNCLNQINERLFDSLNTRGGSIKITNFNNNIVW